MTTTIAAFYLIISVYSDGTVVVPMQTQQACVTAMSNIPNRYRYCIDSKTGEVFK